MDRIEEIRKLKNQGLSMRKIGEIFGISGERVRQLLGMSDEEKKKRQARAKAKSIVRLGLVAKEPCQVCGGPNAEMHHEDYDNPHDIIWLCRKHHDEHHHPRR